MKLSFWRFSWDQLTRKVPPVVEENLEGKTIIVTGANNGLGFETCKHFARMGAGKLIMACRDKGRGEAALASTFIIFIILRYGFHGTNRSGMIEIKEETGHKNTELYILDLANFASVKAFVQRFTQEERRLDILVENAGVVPDSNFPVTEDGWEPTSVHHPLS